jgi:hypothetical protein
MIKRLLALVLGAVLTLELDRWWARRRARYSPGHLTTSFLDKVNNRLEARR